MVQKLNFQKGNRGRTVFVIFNTLLMFAILLFMFVPIMKVISDSLDQRAGYTLTLWPKEFTLNGYANIVQRSALYKPFIISVVFTAVGTMFYLGISTMGAYVLNQKKIPGAKGFLYFMMFTMMFQGGLIPLYMVVRGIGLSNNLLAPLLTAGLGQITYYVILLKNFFGTIPASLSEAAEIDGCTPMGIFLQIVLPMSKAGLAAVGLFYAVDLWNHFFYFVIFINDREWYNFQVKLRELVLQDEQLDLGEVQVFPKTLQNAAIIVAMIPVLILYPFLQKHFVKGINLGAVKG